MLSKGGGRIVSWVVQPFLRLLAMEKTLVLCISWYYFLLSLTNFTGLLKRSLFWFFQSSVVHMLTCMQNLCLHGTPGSLSSTSRLAEVVLGTTQTGWFRAEDKGGGVCLEQLLTWFTSPASPCSCAHCVKLAVFEANSNIVFSVQAGISRLILVYSWEYTLVLTYKVFYQKNFSSTVFSSIKAITRIGIPG